MLVEPQPVVFERLKKGVSQAGLLKKAVSLGNYAVCNASATITFYVVDLPPKDSFGDGHAESMATQLASMR